MGDIVHIKHYCTNTKVTKGRFKPLPFFWRRLSLKVPFGQKTSLGGFIIVKKYIVDMIDMTRLYDGYD